MSFTPAYACLAMMYDRGAEGVPQDLVEARKWYQRTIDAGALMAGWAQNRLVELHGLDDDDDDDDDGEEDGDDGEYNRYVNDPYRHCIVPWGYYSTLCA